MLANSEGCINSWFHTSDCKHIIYIQVYILCNSAQLYLITKGKKGSITCPKTSNIYHVEIRADFYSPCQIPNYHISIMAS